MRNLLKMFVLENKAKVNHSLWATVPWKIMVIVGLQLMSLKNVLHSYKAQLATVCIKWQTS